MIKKYILSAIFCLIGTGAWADDVMHKLTVKVTPDYAYGSDPQSSASIDISSTNNNPAQHYPDRGEQSFEDHVYTRVVECKEGYEYRLEVLYLGYQSPNYYPKYRIVSWHLDGERLETTENPLVFTMGKSDCTIVIF